MRILIGTDTYFPHANGVSYFTQRLAKGLVSRGHDVLVIAPADKFKLTKTKIDGVNVVGIRSLAYPFYDKGYRFTPPGFIRKDIDKVIDKFKPDVVHVQSHFFICQNVFKSAKARSIPLVGTNHFMPENFLRVVKLNKKLEHTLAGLAWKQFAIMYRQMDIVTTPTASAAKVLEAAKLKNLVRPISNGIDLARFEPDNSNPVTMREKYLIPQDIPAFIYVGRMDKDKQIDVLIRGLAAALPQTPMQLVITGRGPELESLKSLAAKLGVADHVTFTAYVSDEDLPKLYRAMDAFAIASCVELQCISALEAMASGLPIIAADAVALPELAHNGENGFLFPPNNVAKLAKDFVELAKSKALREKFSQASLQIVKKHSYEHTLEAYEQTYADAIAIHAAQLKR